MREIKFALLGVLLFANLIALASAVDVAYVVANSDVVEEEFISVLSEMSLSYELVLPSQISDYDFSSVKFMLVNKDYFNNWNQIPVNDVPALIVNGRHMDEWGWTRHITLWSSNLPLHVRLNNSYDIAEGFDDNIQAYTIAGPDMYYLRNNDIFNGLEVVGSVDSVVYNDRNGVVVIAEEGSVLTKPGRPDTEINANSVFFGITETQYWTNDTRELFKSSMEWLLSGDVVTFDIELRQGQNLISLPLILDTNNASEILALNPEIVSVREFVNGEIAETNEMNNNNGYFLEATADSILTIEGSEPHAQDVALVQGMNLVGITSLADIGLDSLPEEVIEVGRRNEDGSYETATRYFFGWFNEFPLEPGKGYWLKTNEGVIWSHGTE